MDDQLPSAAPDIGNIFKFVTLLLWQAKWLIGATTIFAIAMTFSLYRPTTVRAWTGRTTLTIGLAPPTEYALIGSGPSLMPIEPPRNAVARISDPAFRTKVANQSAFQPATAAFSRAMVASSLRGIAQENDRDVTIELTAGSAADVQAAFSALAAEINKEHGDLVDRRLQLLRARIAEAKSRIALIGISAETLNNRIFRSDFDMSAQLNSSLSTSNLAALVQAWSELRDRIQDDTNVIHFTEPSVLHLHPNTFTLESRSLGTLEASILAGFIMLAAMIVLTVVVGRSVRASVD